MKTQVLKIFNPVKQSYDNFFALVLSIIYFILSFKFSGSEAYQKSGLLAYFMWGGIGLFLNMGFLFSIFNFRPILAVFLMTFSLFINVLIYADAGKFFFYDYLAFIVFSCSLLVILRKVLINVKNIHFKK
jgi:hypothetical protein